MIVVDTSALAAILLGEDDAGRYRKALQTTEAIVMSAVTLHETQVVLLMRTGEMGRKNLWALLLEADIEIAPFDEAQSRLATDAYARFGKGVDPRARLNLCDCAAYALARSLDAPLLFKGEDFSQTDVRRCL